MAAPDPLGDAAIHLAALDRGRPGRGRGPRGAGGGLARRVAVPCAGEIRSEAGIEHPARTAPAGRFSTVAKRARRHLPSPLARRPHFGGAGRSIPQLVSTATMRRGLDAAPGLVGPSSACSRWSPSASIRRAHGSRRLPNGARAVRLGDGLHGGRSPRLGGSPCHRRRPSVFRASGRTRVGADAPSGRRRIDLVDAARRRGRGPPISRTTFKGGRPRKPSRCRSSDPGGDGTVTPTDTADFGSTGRDRGGRTRSRDLARPGNRPRGGGVRMGRRDRRDRRGLDGLGALRTRAPGARSGTGAATFRPLRRAGGLRPSRSGVRFGRRGFQAGAGLGEGADPPRRAGGPGGPRASWRALRRAHRASSGARSSPGGAMPALRRGRGGGRAERERRPPGRLPGPPARPRDVAPVGPAMARLLPGDGARRLPPAGVVVHPARQRGAGVVPEASRRARPGALRNDGIGATAFEGPGGSSSGGRVDMERSARRRGSSSPSAPIVPPSLKSASALVGPASGFMGAGGSPPTRRPGARAGGRRRAGTPRAGPKEAHDRRRVGRPAPARRARVRRAARGVIHAAAGLGGGAGSPLRVGCSDPRRPAGMERPARDLAENDGGVGARGSLPSHRTVRIGRRALERAARRRRGPRRGAPPAASARPSGGGGGAACACARSRPRPPAAPCRCDDPSGASSCRGRVVGLGVNAEVVRPGGRGRPGRGARKEGDDAR